MIDAKRGLGIQNMFDLERRELQGIFGTKNPTKEQIRKYIRTEQGITKKPTDDFNFKYVRSDHIEKIIKNCRGVKQCNDDINRINK